MAVKKYIKIEALLISTILALGVGCSVESDFEEDQTLEDSFQLVALHPAVPVEFQYTLQGDVEFAVNENTRQNLVNLMVLKNGRRLGSFDTDVYPFVSLKDYDNGYNDYKVILTNLGSRKTRVSLSGYSISTSPTPIEAGNDICKEVYLGFYDKAPVEYAYTLGDGGCNRYGCWTEVGGGCNEYGCWKYGEDNCDLHDSVRDDSHCTQKYQFTQCNQSTSYFDNRECLEIPLSGTSVESAYTYIGGGCNRYGCWTEEGGGCNKYGCWKYGEDNCDLHDSVRDDSHCTQKYQFHKCRL